MHSERGNKVVFYLSHFYNFLKKYVINQKKSKSTFLEMATHL